MMGRETSATDGALKKNICGEQNFLEFNFASLHATTFNHSG